MTEKTKAAWPKPRGTNRLTTSDSEKSSTESGIPAIKLGSRGSALALIQDHVVINRLKANSPALEFEVDTVRTRGDVDQTSRLAGMGLGIFVKELEQELLEGKLDIAVHSLKDMPTLQPEGLTLGATLDRQDPRDVLVNRWDCPLDQLPQGARIGTSSPRRRAQLMNLCPQARVLPIRGSVDTRLNKAKSDDYDGAVLAAAGLIRLGLTGDISEYLSAQEFVPPPGQGVLAVEIRTGDHRMETMLSPVENAETRFAITAERAFLEILGGGCQVPVGAYAKSNGEQLVLTVFLASEDGEKCFRAELRGQPHEPKQLANDAYLELVEQGAGQLLAQSAANPVSDSD